MCAFRACRRRMCVLATHLFEDTCVRSLCVYVRVCVLHLTAACRLQLKSPLSPCFVAEHIECTTMRFNKLELATLAQQPSNKFEREGTLYITEKQDGFFRRTEGIKIACIQIIAAQSIVTRISTTSTTSISSRFVRSFLSLSFTDWLHTNKPTHTHQQLSQICVGVLCVCVQTIRTNDRRPANRRSAVARRRSAALAAPQKVRPNCNRLTLDLVRWVFWAVILLPL